MKTSIKKIGTEGLARLLVRQLYQIYDYGGISAGRSYSSLLLESAKDIMRPPKVSNYDLWFSSELVDEAERRAKEGRNLIQLSFCEKVSSWKNLSIAFLLLRKLSVWVANLKPNGPEEREAGFEEKLIISAVLGLFIAEENPAVPVEKLVEQASLRLRVKHQRESKRRLGY